MGLIGDVPPPLTFVLGASVSASGGDGFNVAGFLVPPRPKSIDGDDMRAESTRRTAGWGTKTSDEIAISCMHNILVACLKGVAGRLF